MYSLLTNSTVVYPNMVTQDLVREVDDYGSIQEGLLAVPLAMMDQNNANSNHSSPPSWNTKKFVFGIIGLTAAVASGASLFFSIMDSSVQARIDSFRADVTDEIRRQAQARSDSFLLNGGSSIDNT